MSLLDIITPPTTTAVAARLCLARRALNINTTEMARRMGRSRTWVSDHETGVAHSITEAELKQWAEVTETTVDWLTGKGPKLGAG